MRQIYFSDEGGIFMRVNGTLINYYFHCKRQCYLHGNRLNLEDNSEQVKIGKAIHQERAEDSKNTEIAIENIRLDKLTKEYLTEIKKSDADVEAAKWQLLYYLSVLKSKGIVRKGRLEFVEKNKRDKKFYSGINKRIRRKIRFLYNSNRTVTGRRGAARVYSQSYL